MSTDTVIKEIMEYLFRELGINPFDAKEVLVLSRAIDYANPNYWVSEPQSKEEQLRKEIFTIRATHYFKRKLLHPFDDVEKIKRIEENEHRECALIKARYLPTTN